MPRQITIRSNNFHKDWYPLLCKGALAYLRKIGPVASQYDAAELANQAWLQLARRLEPKHDALKPCWKWINSIFYQYTNCHKMKYKNHWQRNATKERVELISLDEAIQNGYHPEYFDNIDQIDFYFDIINSIGTLNESDRLLLLSKIQGKTLRQIGNEVGLTGERVRQKLKNILDSLQAA